MTASLSNPATTVVASLSAGIAAASRAIRDAWRASPDWLVLTAALLGLQALAPVIQMVLVGAVAAAIDDHPADWSAILPPLVGLAGVVGSAFAIGQVANASAQRMALRLRLRYRSAVTEAASALHPVELSRPEVARHLQAGYEASSAADSIAGHSLQVLATAITATTLCAAIWVVSPAAGLLVLLSLAPTLFAFTLVAAAEAKGWPLVGEHERRASYATELLFQQRTGTELAALGTSSQIAALASRERRKAMVVLDGLIGVAMKGELAAASVTGVLLAGALVMLVVSGVAGAGAAASIVGILTGLQAVRASGYAFGAVMSAAPHHEVLRRLRQTTEATEERPVPARMRPVALAVERLTVMYPGASVPALDDVSFRAARGEMVALVGVNGAGKTTAVNAMLGIIEPHGGRVEIDGLDLASLPARARLAHFGLLTQEFGRYELTVREAVALGTRMPVDDDAIWTALVVAGADRLVEALPDGLDTMLGQQWGGVGLSGGQWQRIALARIAVRDAGIWILDEPTSSVDAEAEVEIFDRLRRTGADRITVVVSHRAWTLRDMDRIYVFDEGRVVQHGRYEELIAQPGRFAEIFAEQV